MLIEAPVISDDHIRTVNLLLCTASNADVALNPAEFHTAADNDSIPANSSSAEEQDLFDVSGPLEDAIRSQSTAVLHSLLKELMTRAVLHSL